MKVTIIVLQECITTEMAVYELIKS